MSLEIKWEYKVVTISALGKDFTKSNEKEFNRLGDQGWELVNFCIDPNKMDGSFYKFIFKRHTFHHMRIQYY